MKKVFPFSHSVFQGQALAKYASELEYLSRAVTTPGEPYRTNWTFGAITHRVESLQALLAIEPENDELRDLLAEYQQLESQAYGLSIQPPYTATFESPKQAKPSNRHIIWKVIQNAALLHLIIMVLASCGEITPPAPEIPPYKFDYTIPVENIQDAGCYPGTLEEGINIVGDLEEKLLDRFAGKMTPRQLERQSLKFHPEILGEFEIVKGKDTKILEDILAKLVAVLNQHRIEHPDFKVFLVRTKSGFPIINAWTTGSYVYFTTDILDFCNYEPGQLAAIMGHEIGHTLHKHTSHFSQRDRLACDLLGERWGKVLVKFYQRNIASALGQANELQADLGALILMYEAGYDPAETTKPFQKFAETRNRDPSAIERLLSSHPLDETRLNCLAGAIERARNSATAQEKTITVNR